MSKPKIPSSPLLRSRPTRRESSAERVQKRNPYDPKEGSRSKSSKEGKNAPLSSFPPFPSERPSPYRQERRREQRTAKQKGSLLAPFPSLPLERTLPRKDLHEGIHFCCSPSFLPPSTLAASQPSFLEGQAVDFPFPSGGSTLPTSRPRNSLQDTRAGQNDSARDRARGSSAGDLLLQRGSV